MGQQLYTRVIKDTSFPVMTPNFTSVVMALNGTQRKLVALVSSLLEYIRLMSVLIECEVCLYTGKQMFVFVYLAEVSCPPLNLSYATLFGNGSSFGDIVKFTCDEGYISGNNRTGVLECKADSQWNGSTSGCMRMCDYISSS